jgi:protein-disulfide isomerase
LALAVILALVLAVPLIVASELEAKRAAPSRAHGATPARAFAGIPQNGNALGSPSAPVTLVEYGDLQCPYCAQWAVQTLPVLVARYVRGGRLRIEFDGLAFLGPDSVTALRTAVAAGRQNRLWDVVGALYLRQGAENSGWVSPAVLGEVARAAGLDPARLARAREQTWVTQELLRAETSARRAGVRGTPSFALGRTGRPPKRIELRSLDAAGILPAIDAALAK